MIGALVRNGDAFRTVNGSAPAGEFTIGDDAILHLICPTAQMNTSLFPNFEKVNDFSAIPSVHGVVFAFLT
ncbi:hypothetical protein [Bradyrhizobium sp. MOS003]|uniref:hypothetical protein n=1 Tax=Bradyrhizobium sp. MOS003 TaxID=2133946 RepID=UPI000D4F4F72|nr:hypothetical protein [Bradyrhizobium sp. MOS003]PSO15221.1 hypothetical protein C7G42_27865 [Bradyrhizobium sp. MOS003]